MAYATVEQVEEALGVELTPDQQSYATTLLDAATAWINEYCGRTFDATDAIDDERQRLYGETVYLKVVPVETVTAVRLRSRRIGATWTTLAVGREYEVVNLATGELRIQCTWYEAEMAADYTPAQVCPDDISDAEVQIVTGRMQGQVSGDGEVPENVKKYSVGGELTVERFTDAEIAQSVMNPLRTLQLHRPKVIV